MPVRHPSMWRRTPAANLQVGDTEAASAKLLDLDPTGHLHHTVKIIATDTAAADYYL